MMLWGLYRRAKSKKKTSSSSLRPASSQGSSSFQTNTRSTSSSLGQSPYQPMTAAVKDLVENVIEGNKIVVFSKSWCPYCRKAKTFLAEEYPNASAKIIELNETENGDAIQDYLLSKTGQRTVPNIFINKTHVGGSDDLDAKQRSGEIALLVNASHL